MQLSTLTAALGRFLAELQRRKVLRVATGYVVAAWIILQVAVAVQTAWALSASFSGTTLSLLIIGFPAAVGLAWFFEITPQGIKRTSASGDGTITKLQTTDFVLAGALVLVFCIGVAQFFWPREARVATAPKTAAAAAETPKIEAPRLGDKSIAVLPFANLSPDKENVYFADGLTEEVLNLLAKIGDLKVISRTSSFAFKGKTTPLPEIAKQLGVRHIVEGSVRAKNDELRVTAQLIDVSTDTHLWSETFERKSKDFFALQDEIARKIARTLDVEVTMAAPNRDPPTTNLEAYRLYLEGRALLRDRDEFERDQALAYLKSAVAKDPKFAEAHATLAVLYFTLAGYNRGSFARNAPLVLESAQNALKLNRTVSLAHGILGALDRSSLRWDSAVANGEKEVALSPSSSVARTWLGITQIALGRVDAATTTFKEAERLDPVFGTARLWSMTAALVRGDEVQATKLAEAMRHVPSSISRYGHFVLALLAFDGGDGRDAELHFRQSLRSSDKKRPVTDLVAKALHSVAARDAALRAVAAEAASDPDFDFRIPLIILRADETLLQLLNKGIESGYTSAIPVTLIHFWSPRFKTLRGDQRFREFVRNARLVDYWKKHGWPDRCRAKGEDDFECS
jgi:TolB-like protein/Tfp pilus assembly protein PilF